MSALRLEVREAQNDEIRYILDKKPSRRTGDDLATVKTILEERGVWKGLEVSAITLTEMLRTMRHGAISLCIPQKMMTAFMFCFCHSCHRK